MCGQCVWKEVREVMRNEEDRVSGVHDSSETWWLWWEVGKE